jgi:hypothetical protein
MGRVSSSAARDPGFGGTPAVRVWGGVDAQDERSAVVGPWPNACSASTGHYRAAVRHHRKDRVAQAGRSTRRMRIASHGRRPVATTRPVNAARNGWRRP